LVRKLIWWRNPEREFYIINTTKITLICDFLEKLKPLSIIVPDQW